MQVKILIILLSVIFFSNTYLAPTIKSTTGPNSLAQPRAYANENTIDIFPSLPNKVSNQSNQIKIRKITHRPPFNIRLSDCILYLDSPPEIQHIFPRDTKGESGLCFHAREQNHSFIKLLPRVPKSALKKIITSWPAMPDIPGVLNPLNMHVLLYPNETTGQLFLERPFLPPTQGWMPLNIILKNGIQFSKAARNSACLNLIYIIKELHEHEIFPLKIRSKDILLNIFTGEVKFYKTGNLLLRQTRNNRDIPHLLTPERAINKTDGKPGDIYRLARLLYAINTGAPMPDSKLPSPELTTKEYQDMNPNLKPDKNPILTDMHPCFLKLFPHLWAADPEKRWDIQQVFSYVFDKFEKSNQLDIKHENISDPEILINLLNASENQTREQILMRANPQILAQIPHNQWKTILTLDFASQLRAIPALCQRLIAMIPTQTSCILLPFLPESDKQQLFELIIQSGLRDIFPKSLFIGLDPDHPDIPAFIDPLFQDQDLYPLIILRSDIGTLAQKILEHPISFFSYSRNKLIKKLANTIDNIDYCPSPEQILVSNETTLKFTNHTAPPPEWLIYSESIPGGDHRSKIYALCMLMYLLIKGIPKVPEPEYIKFQSISKPEQREYIQHIISKSLLSEPGSSILNIIVHCLKYPTEENWNNLLNIINKNSGNIY
ncbi:MAG: hypothetical protein NkDv07_0134 [Candidatus Improbicoccus devescovinae]|nr:MAG: hypothetical protein NkDv07_0134 [Candidatus Improbicoccus devescovinae]